MSVSSIRRMNVPPVFRAKSQLYSAVRKLPICNWPVGEGANRTRTLPLSAINLMVTKSDAIAGVRGETNFLVRSFASQRFRACLLGGDRDRLYSHHSAASEVGSAVERSNVRVIRSCHPNWSSSTKAQA